MAASSDLGSGATHVYTGDGKGKTTAALGLALRAVGRDLNVYIIQFMKRWGYGEHLGARRLEPQLKMVQVGKPYFVAHEDQLDPEDAKSLRDVEIFPPGCPPRRLVEQAAEGLQMARSAMLDESWDLIVLDEINVALHYGLVTEDDVLQLVCMRPAGVELILTGRQAPQSIVDAADLVTEMCEVKHYWTRGISARRGIEE